MLNPRIALLGAPTYLASIMAIDPHHAAATHVGEAAGQREHVVWQGIAVRSWSEFLCLGGYLAPPRQVVEPPQRLVGVNLPVVSDNPQAIVFIKTNSCQRARSSACLCVKVWAAGHGVRSAWPRVALMDVGLSNARSGNIDLVAVSCQP
jgi:hypothetical protein